MVGNNQSGGWLARRREEWRLKRERTGDTPQKLAERRKSPDPVSSKEAMARTGVVGFLGG